jgi:hypothetical protein
VGGGAAGSGLEDRDECRAADGGASGSRSPSSTVCASTSVFSTPCTSVREGVGKLGPLEGARSSEIMMLNRVP